MRQGQNKEEIEARNFPHKKARFTISNRNRSKQEASIDVALAKKKSSRKRKGDKKKGDLIVETRAATFWGIAPVLGAVTHRLIKIYEKIPGMENT